VTLRVISVAIKSSNYSKSFMRFSGMGFCTKVFEHAKIHLGGVTVMQITLKYCKLIK